jgi:hypothetical protein
VGVYIGDDNTVKVTVVGEVMAENLQAAVAGPAGELRSPRRPDSAASPRAS